jgi:hypothetical protein
LIEKKSNIFNEDSEGNLVLDWDNLTDPEKDEPKLSKDWEEFFDRLRKDGILKDGK